MGQKIDGTRVRTLWTVPYVIENFFESVAYFADLWDTHGTLHCTSILIKHLRYVSSYLSSISSNKSSLRTCSRNSNNCTEKEFPVLQKIFIQKLNIKFWINLPEQIMCLPFIHSQNLTTFPATMVKLCDASYVQIRNNTRSQMPKCCYNFPQCYNFPSAILYCQHIFAGR